MSRTYTTKDIEQFNKAGEQLRANGFDEFTAEGTEHNADLLDAYFQQNLTVPVTIPNIYKAIEAQKTSYKWLSPAQVEYHRVASENPAEASTKLTAWFATQGKPGTLVNSGDEGHENFSILLTELRGREVNPTTIQQAIGRIAFNGRRQLHVVPTPRALSPAAQADPNHKPGVFIQGANKTPADYKAEQDQAAAKARGDVRTPSLVNEARNKAESLQGNTAAKTQSIRRVVIMGDNREIDWEKTLTARLSLQRQFNIEEQSRFIRR